MVKMRSVFRCGDCGASAPTWQGRCPACGEWNTLVEERVEASRAGSSKGLGLRGAMEPAVPIAEVDTAAWAARSTGVDELDRVLGGGLVPGSVTLVGGEPGVGKSTLLTQVAAAVACAGTRALYVSAEESSQQVRVRAERLGPLSPLLWLASETSAPNIVAHLDQVRPELVVIDSIQTVHDPELGSAPGTVTQVRECAHRLVHEAKARAIAILLVGHVTKDGGLAGPRVLEHVVDTVLAFEGDRHHALRMLRAVKHRFGSTTELGLFEMGAAGLVSVPDPSALFLADRRSEAAGSAVVPMMEGHRPLLVEVQALVAPSSLPQPRRSAQGLDSGRMAMLLAVLDQRAGVGVGPCDVFTLAVGGVKVTEPAADLAVCLAIASSATGVALPHDLIACAEVGLGGELRQVSHTPRRLAEAARLGFRRAILPFSAPEAPPGLVALRAATVAEALELARTAASVPVATTIHESRPGLVEVGSA
ncbi:MAG: DNA repair protein RadA [Acidimicrobiales bacterium]